MSVIAGLFLLCTGFFTGYWVFNRPIDTGLVDGLRADVAQLTAENSGLRDTNNQLKSSNSAIGSKLADAVAGLRNANLTIERLNGKTGELQATVDRLAKRIGELESTIDGLNGAINALNGSIALNAERLKQCLEIIGRAKAIIGEAEVTTGSASELIASIIDAYHRLRDTFGIPSI